MCTCSCCIDYQERLEHGRDASPEISCNCLSYPKEERCDCSFCWQALMEHYEKYKSEASRLAGIEVEAKALREALEYRNEESEAAYFLLGKFQEMNAEGIFSLPDQQYVFMCQTATWLSEHTEHEAVMPAHGGGHNVNA